PAVIAEMSVRTSIRIRLEERLIRNQYAAQRIGLRRSREITLLCSPKVTHHHLKEVALLPLGKAAFARRQITLEPGGAALRWLIDLPSARMSSRKLSA